MAQEIAQPIPLFLGPLPIPIDAVMPQVNTGQDDLVVPVGDESADFLQHMIDGTTGQLRAYVRNDAVAAT